MKLRTVIIGVAVASATGYVIYDSNSPESRRARELHDIEKLKRDIKIADCYPQGPLAKAFAAAVANDTPATPIENEATRRSVIKHDCIRGSSNHGTVDRLAASGGEQITPYLGQVSD